MENQEGTLTELFAPASTAPPTCTVLPITTAAQFEIKSATINMLPEFCAFESEQPYIHLNKFLKFVKHSETKTYMKHFPIKLNNRLQLFLRWLADQTHPYLDSILKLGQVQINLNSTKSWVV
eukprot:TRINITY_DN18416_c0_g1_i1.p1 TRINITY_DN18416_c0_g1~~TRINITY_DN18416_c0_g1_i1.p1  ORF type:complete len:122 (-),score=12.84 TRINITY_DN18416_c0_g1_i1:562-927(-)